MSMIKIQNLTFPYDDSYDNVFENVSFQVDTDWKLGLTGRNGRGKTTLLKLLMGKYDYSGKIFSTVSFEYFPFEVKNKNSFGIDIIQEKSGLNNYEYWKISKELSLLETNDEILYREFRTLSGGEQVKILLVSLFLKENAFLLIDEPTNHLDSFARKVVSNYLRAKKGFILVSHDRQFLDNSVDHILSINKTNIEIQKGNFSSWLKNKQNQDNFEISRNEKLKKDISRLKDSARKSANWSNKIEKSKHGGKCKSAVKDTGFIGHKAAKLMKRSKNAEVRVQTAIEEKSKLLKNIETMSDLKINFLKHNFQRLIELKNVSLFYSEKMVCENLNFEINQGDRVAICGKNGCGKSTILKAILGDESIKIKGGFVKASNLKISYLSQDTSNLVGNLTEFANTYNIDESLLKAILRKFDFSRIQFEKNISDFSEGQKKKVLIAKSLCEKAHLYLWDEPFNFIDILSRIQIENLILKFQPTMIFVEHDTVFTTNIATKTVEI